MTATTAAENAALVMWTGSDHNHAAFMAAVREAIRITEARYEQAEDFRLAVADQALTEMSGMLMAFTASGDLSRVRAFLGDLARVVDKATEAIR